MCAFHDHSLKTVLCCTVCALSTRNNALCIVVTNNTDENYVAPLDCDEHFEN
jgi:hypothetical protein